MTNKLSDETARELLWAAEMADLLIRLRFNSGEIKHDDIGKEIIIKNWDRVTSVIEKAKAELEGVK